MLRRRACYGRRRTTRKVNERRGRAESLARGSLSQKRPRTSVVTATRFPRKLIDGMWKTRGAHIIIS
jgi:hypothetical protein